MYSIIKASSLLGSIHYSLLRGNQKNRVRLGAQAGRIVWAVAIDKRPCNKHAEKCAVNVTLGCLGFRSQDTKQPRFLE